MKYHLLPEEIILRFEEKYKDFMIFETTKFDKDNKLSYLFINSIAKMKLYDINYIDYFFCEIEKYLKSGFYVAGFFSYELGYGFLDKKISDNFIKKKYSFPLAYFCVFEEPIIFDHKNGSFNKKIILPKFKKINNLKYDVKNLKYNIGLKNYGKKIKKIKEYIRNGDVYQINFTIKCNFNFYGSISSFYNKLKKKQKVEYACYIKSDEFSVLSFSPELFFRKKGNMIILEPMKGTISRGVDLEDDNKKMELLLNCSKNKSENIMIVDLMRNDIGKVSEVNKVEIKKLFNIKKYESLFQMTSVIRSQLKSNIKYYDLFKSIFPSGSVTGAPKIRAMQIISELEKNDRGVYTGATGFFSPNGSSIFNVSIRTIKIEGANGEMGIGSGIVWDSNTRNEFDECKLKSYFLTRKEPDFMLFETILYINKKKSYFLLNKHLKRLENSAKYFGFNYDLNIAKMKILNLRSSLSGNCNYKVKLFITKDGKMDFNYEIIKNNEKDLDKFVIISKEKTDKRNIFLYHKTTNRVLYDMEFKKFRELGYFDVLFRNKEDDFTEFSRGNLFIFKKGYFYTPPKSCGLLPGVYREYFIDKHKVIQKKIKFDDLLNSEKIFFTNSIVGLQKVNLVYT